MLLVEVAKTDGLFLQRCSILVCSLRDVCSGVVANVRVESGDEHETLIEKFINAIAVGLNASNAVEVEGFTGIGEEGSRVQDVLNDHRLEHIELEVARHATNADGRVVTHNLGADHSNSLALSRVNLARHDRRARLVLRERKLAKAASRARAKETNIVSDFHQGTCKSIEGSVEMHKCILRGKSLELVGCSPEVMASLLFEALSDFLCKADK